MYLLFPKDIIYLFESECDEIFDSCSSALTSSFLKKVGQGNAGNSSRSQGVLLSHNACCSPQDIASHCICITSIVCERLSSYTSRWLAAHSPSHKVVNNLSLHPPSLLYPIHSAFRLNPPDHLLMYSYTTIKCAR